MKKLFLLLALAVGFIACNNDNDDVDYIVTGRIEVVPDSLEFGSALDSAYLSVFVNTLFSGNMIDWKVTSDQTWCTPAPTYGEGSRLIKVNVTENTGAERVAYISVNPRHTNIVLKIKVKQEGVAVPPTPTL